MVSIAANRSVTLTSITLQNAQAVLGGIVYVESGANATFNNVHLKDGMANGSGGIVYAAAGASLYVSGYTLIDGGSAGNAGGGLYLEGTAEFVNNVQVRDSHAPSGGGVAIAGEGHLIVRSSHIGDGPYPNSAGNGGGVYMTGQSRFEMRGASSIRWNDATVGKGGGIFADGNVTIDLYSGRVYANEATAEGGGIYAANGASVLLDTFVMVGEDNPAHGNSAVRGGGIYADGAASLQIRDNAAVRHNNAGDGGGGLYLTGATELAMTGGTIAANVAAGWGGGIALADGQVTLEGTVVEGNQAAEGGGVGLDHANAVLLATNVQIISNTATLNGGGIASHDGTVLMMDASGTSRLAGNQAGQHGGGFYHSGSGGAGFMTEEVRDSELHIEGNTAGGHGGGFYSENGGVIQVIRSVWLSDNTALGDGGGWYHDGGTVMAIGFPEYDLPQISGNRSENGRGGGVYLNDVASGPGSSAPFANLAISGNWADTDGGGVYVSNSSHVLLVNALLQDNEAGQHGGGLLASGSRVEVWHHADSCAAAQQPANHYCSAFRNNTATASGGAIQLQLAAELVLENTAIISNSAALGSGVMSASNGDHLEITNSLFAENTGKALFIANDAFLDLVQTTFAGNEWAIDIDDNGATVNAGNNIIWGNDFGVESAIALAAGCSIAQNGVGGIVADPLFHSTGRGDYRLQAGSPAVDACNIGTDRDLDGVGRPQGADYDMGAFELGPPLVLLPAQLFVTEGDAGTTPALLTVSLSEPSAETVTIDVNTADVRATAGVDYVAVAATISFPPGTTSQAVPLQILGDVIYEGDEPFEVQLANASGAVLAATTVSVLIEDDDPLPEIAVAAAQVAEGDSGSSPVAVALSLSHPSAFTVTVDFTTNSGTATAGADYETTSGTVTLAPGEVTAQIIVTIYGDESVEGNETFQVVLSKPEGAMIAPGGGQAVVTIIDDDDLKMFLPMIVR
jgi:predicted outer membrane repeat protein